MHRKWSTIPKAAAFHNQPSHFAVWRLFVSQREHEEFWATLVDQITLADPHFTFGVDLRLVANEPSIASSSLGVSSQVT